MFEVIYKYQRWEGFESYIKVDDEKWIRLDFLLEYFLTNDVKITKEFKGNFKSYLGNVKYASIFLKEFGDLILDESHFNYEKYIRLYIDKSKIDMVLEKMKNG
ncbi:MAG: hypothetical protein R2798_12075 [Chitinophagales bacterium]|nr:hypothetical protein [Chitinophagales bacterium]